MVTYFNRKDLVSFGTYLMSEKRKADFTGKHEEDMDNGLFPLPVSEAMKIIHKSDIDNWLDGITTAKDHETG